RRRRPGLRLDPGSARRLPQGRRDGELMRPRLGCLGLGWIGRHRLKALVASGLVEIAGLADVDGAALVAAAAIAPAAARGQTLEDLIDLDLDGIVIATPSARHAAESIRA